MKTKAIIFDKDGTLLDFEAFWIPVTEKAVDEILLGAKATHVRKEAVYKAYGIAGGVTDITGSLCCGTYDDMTADLQKVLVEYGVNIPYETVKKLTVDAYHNNTSAGEFLPTASNLKSVLESLKEKGAKLFVVTSDDSVVAGKCLKELGIFELFEEILAADGKVPAKPNPYYIEYLAEKYGFEKSEMVMVGDTLTDMRFAQNGGIKAIGLAKSVENEAKLRAYTDVVLPDPSTLDSHVE